MDGIRLYTSDSRAVSPTRETNDTGPSFSDEFGKALGAVEGLQTAADREVEKVALGGGNLHETALALEKADIGMRVMTKVRNKLVDAYQEVMRMSV